MQQKRIRTFAMQWMACALMIAMVTSPADARAQNEEAVTLTLPQAIDMALRQNRSLKLAQLGVTDSQYKKEIARSSYFPRIKNESSVLHVTELAGVAIPAGAFGVPQATGPIPHASLFIDQGSLTSYTSGTQLLQPLTQMFKIHEANRAAAADVNIAKVQVSQAENEVALKVRQLYYGILIAQLQLEAANDEVSAAQTKAVESNDAVAKGRALEIAALESRASLLNAKQTVLSRTLQIRDLTLALVDLLGLPLTSHLHLDSDSSTLSLSLPEKGEGIRLARDLSPAVQTARQNLAKARAGLGVAKDAYIPDITGLARYSYQSGVPLLVHNFGTFGFSFSYDLFDGGRRLAELRDARTVVSQAEINLDRVEDEVAVEVESAYDKVEQLQSMVQVAEEALSVRTEAARLTDRQFELDAALASARTEAHAKATAAKASLLEATLGLSLAQGDLKRLIGQLPR